MNPTTNQVHVPGQLQVRRSGKKTVSKPWTVDNVPPSLKNFTRAEKARFVEVANKVLAETGDEAMAIRAGLGAVNRLRVIGKANHSKSLCMACKDASPVVDVLWNGGKQRSWFCQKCYKSWSADKADRIIGVNKIEDGVANKRFKVIRHSPREMKKAGTVNKSTILKINGQPVTLGQLAQAWLSKAGVGGQGTGDSEEFLTDPHAERSAGSPIPDPPLTASILKADKRKQVVYGVPLVPDAVDSQRDKVSAEEIEAAAWGFMKYYGQNQARMDEQHETILPLDKAYPVESYLAPVALQFGSETIPQGSWIVGVHVPDTGLWKKVESGEINAFSVRGMGKRTPVK
jgi:hypothetical protein